MTNNEALTNVKNILDLSLKNGSVQNLETAVVINESYVTLLKAVAELDQVHAQANTQS